MERRYEVRLKELLKDAVLRPEQLQGIPLSAITRPNCRCTPASDGRLIFILCHVRLDRRHFPYRMSQRLWVAPKSLLPKRRRSWGLKFEFRRICRWAIAAAGTWHAEVDPENWTG